MEIVKMKCKGNIVKLFITDYYPKDNNEYQEMKKHIANCKRCFTELIRLAPTYDTKALEEE